MKKEDKQNILENIKKIKLNNEEKAMLGIVAILLVAVIVLAYPYLKNIKIATPEKVYSLDVVRIEGCSECFSLDLVSNTLSQNSNIKIKNEKSINYSSSEAQELINKYNIKKIPALIVTSKNIDKINLQEAIFRKDKNAFIFDKPVPYIDLISTPSANPEEVNGIVNLIEVYDSTCKECASLSKVKTQFENMNIKINRYEMVSSSSDEGKELIRNNNITYLPALLISKDINEYWWVFSQIKSSLEENNVYYRLSLILYPYKEISTGLVKGKVKITYITNKSCIDCFNATQLKSPLQQLGVYIESEKYTDVSSIDGKSLLVKYNITAIPTIILSKEISDYATLKKTLEGVGSFENDETFVFRKLDALNVKYQRTGI